MIVGRNFWLSKIYIVGSNFWSSKITIVGHKFGPNRITIDGHNFKPNRITIVSHNFGPSKIMILGHNFFLWRLTLIFFFYIVNQPMSLTVTASQAQQYLVSTLWNSTNLYSTLLDFNTSAFNSCIQHFSIKLAFNTSCIQHDLISTIMDSTILVINNNGFNNPCFQRTLDIFFNF